MATASTALLGSSAYRLSADLHGGPHLAVLDTSCVRTGLKSQLDYGAPPRSIREVRGGSIRLLMEYATLAETARKLGDFSEQLGVPTQRLAEMLNRDWLPFITVVKLPDHLRRVDERATAVEALDRDDYPTAALAALLSPCILLTHNTRHFSPLGVCEWAQGTTAVVAAVEAKNGDQMFSGMLVLPAAPVAAVGIGVSWLAEQFGRAAWLLVPLLAGGGYLLYNRQSPERREQLKQGAKDAGRAFLETASQLADEASQARQLLIRSVVPGPARRTPVAAVLRELARSSESMSAQQLCDVLADDVRPTVTSLRSYLHGHKDGDGPFVEVRRGGFELGRRGSHRILIPAAE